MCRSIRQQTGTELHRMEDVIQMTTDSFAKELLNDLTFPTCVNVSHIFVS